MRSDCSSRFKEPVFQIRDFQREDFPSLCEIDRMCFPEGIAYSPEEIALSLAQRGAFACVAVVDGQVVAFILAYQKKEQIGHIVTLDVHPDFRRQSMGHHLMERAEERLRQRGAVRVVLEVAVTNETAQRFYEKRGYLRQKLLRKYYADRSDAYLMEKRFASI